MRSMTWLAPAVALTLAACGGGDAAAEADMSEANPCAANPCAATDVPVDAIRQGDRELSDHGMSWEDLAARGAELWKDPSLSGAGATSCATCHTGDGTAMMNASFAEPYPHAVDMAKDRAGLDQVNAAEMVQLCMSIPMAAEPLAWESLELAALAARVEQVQVKFDASGSGAMNPCAANPCAANPCAANPCAASGMNPCASNPCGADR